MSSGPLDPMPRFRPTRRSREFDRDRILEGIPAAVRTALHLCRGNHKSKWIYNGPMDAYPERMFNELPYDGFLMEWEDTAREGDYSALRHVPDGPIVAMGIMSSKKPRVETVDELERHIEKRASTATLTGSRSRRSAGFASTYIGNEVTEDIQWRKLETLVQAAEQIWPRT